MTNNQSDLPNNHQDLTKTEIGEWSVATTGLPLRIKTTNKNKYQEHTI